MLDDDSNITSETLGIMNQIALYFKKLKASIAKFSGTFAQLLGYFQSEIESEQIVNDRFLVQLDICNQNLSALRELVTRNTEKSENTLKTIERCLQGGRILWSKDGDFDFKIRVTMEKQQ